MLLVSVVIPVYNSEKFLSDCIHSISVQTYKNLEIILVDDGSRDGSGKLCDLLLETDSRIKVFHNENRGANKARAFGVSQALGEYILFVDSDDTIPDYAIEEFVSNSNGTDIVVGFPWESPDPKRIISINEWRKMCAFGGYVMSPVAKLFKRELLTKDIFDIPSSIRVCEDDIMNLRVSLKTEKGVVILQKKCYTYNKRNNSSVTSTFEWTYQYLEHFCNVYRESIPLEFEHELMPPFIARRVKAVHNLISDSTFHKLNGMGNSELVSSIKKDAKAFSFNFSRWDIITLSYPSSFIIWSCHCLKKKIVIAKEYLKREL